MRKVENVTERKKGMGKEGNRQRKSRWKVMISFGHPGPALDKDRMHDIEH